MGLIQKGYQQMLYEFVKKTNDVIETEEMKFMKFVNAMVLVATNQDPEFKILIDKTIEIGLMEVKSTIDLSDAMTDEEKAQSTRPL